MPAAQGMPPNWMPHILPHVVQDNLFRQENRLGTPLEAVGEALTGHLGLPKGQGLLVGSVPPGSAAAKAGLQPNDILLEVNGKPVPGDLAAFLKALEGIKANTPLDAAVMRKGKKVAVKGLTLSEAPGGLNLQGWDALPPPAKVYVCPVALDGSNHTLLVGERFANGAASPVLTTTFRREDRFTTRYQEGSLVITIVGKVSDGKPVVAQVKVQDGGVEHRYPSVEKVPAEYQDKVRDLVEASEKGQGKIDIKK
jgi:membrane-associated protease RseP (regulator of RpoE activity)